MLEFFAQPFFQRLAYTLLHFLWQGAVVAVLLGAALAGCASGDARRRYAVSLAAFILLLLCPLATFPLVSLPEGERPPRRREKASLTGRAMEPAVGKVSLFGSAHSSATGASPAGTHQQLLPADFSGTGGGDELLSGTHLLRKAGEAVVRRRGSFSPRVLVPWCVLIWMSGTLLLGLRLLLGFAGVGHLRRRHLTPPKSLQKTVDALSRRLRLRHSPAVFLSSRIGDAMVVGFFRPVILLPLSWCTQLPPDVLRSVLAHELAHLRRWDQWVNLLQRLAEVILFYHPAVWWISSLIRREREFCCDEMAAAVVGGPLCYAEALEQVALHFTGTHGWLLANTLGGRKMKMLDRVRHVLGSGASSGFRHLWAAGLLAVCLPLALCVSAFWWSSVRADDGIRREGDRGKRAIDRREGDRREGDRREGDANRREGERRDKIEGEERRRREEAERRRGEERPRRGPEGRFVPRDGRPPHGERDRRLPGPPELRELLELVRDLRNEVRELRREVNELKRHVPHGPPRRFEGERDRRPPARRPERDFDRRPPEGRDRDGVDRRRRPEGDRPGFRREGDRREGGDEDRREGDRGAGDRGVGDRREGDRREGLRRDGNPPEGDRRERDRRQKPETQKDRAGDGEG